MKNRILVMTGVKQAQMREIQIPSLRPDEVLLKVEACGLCTWERYIYKGEEPADFPFHGGHEIAATVVESGSDVQGLPEGTPAAVVNWKRCNACIPCRRGYDNHCETMSAPLPEESLWGPGGFAEYKVAKRYEVFPLGKEVPLERGTLAEPLSCVIRGVKRSGIQPGETAAVVGAGLMGLLFMKVLQQRGIKVAVVQRSRKRREMALSMGADLVVDSSRESWKQELMDFTGGCGVNGVFYTAGGRQMLNDILKIAAIGGSLVIYAPLYSEQPALEIDTLHFRELTVTGSIRHDLQSVYEAVRLLGSGSLDLEGIKMVPGKLENFSREVERADNDRDIHRILLKV